jgi:hypothetical protein
VGELIRRVVRVGFWPGGPAEAYLGDGALYLHGRYETWSLPGLRLRSREFIPGEPALLAFNLYSRGARRLLYVPVPAGHEGEARRMIGDSSTV